MNQSNLSRPVVTIDGPAGSGKGALAVLLAQKLNWVHLDSGSLYRVSAYYLQSIHALQLDEKEQAKRLKNMPLVVQINSVGASELFLGGEKMGACLRTDEISSLSSSIATKGAIREALLTLQRDYGKPQGLVADGRDMGTTIFPEATCKIFLTCDAMIRAKRRKEQLQTQGVSVRLEEVYDSIVQRDKADREREISPLKPASDAHFLDNTDISLEDLLEKACLLLKANSSEEI